MTGKREIKLSGQRILITGAAGFIGSFLARRLVGEVEGATIIGLDNLNDYYDPALKRARLAMIKEAAQTSVWLFTEGDLADGGALEALFDRERPDIVVNLAAQAGVRYSIDHPDTYIQSNLVGFYNLLECVRRHPVAHLVYASSSSVYGVDAPVPFSEDAAADHPVSLYAATKRSNELLAHSYAKLYEIPCTGLRLFTVYGPMGRPDMAYFHFADTLCRGGSIDIFNYGDCKRDFTYVDDIVEGILRVMQGAPEKATGKDGLPIPPWAVYNIGGSHPENLMDFVRILAEELERAGALPADFDLSAHLHLVPMQPGDVPVTYADTGRLFRDYGFTPSIPLREGMRAFADWYQTYRQQGLEG